MTVEPAAPTASADSSRALPDSPEPEGKPTKARAYQKIKLRLSLLVMALELLGLLVLLVAGLSLLLRQSVVQWTDVAVLQVLYFFALLGLAAEVLTLPIDYYRDYVVEHQFGLSTQGFRAWLWDWFKALLVGGVLGLIVIETVYALLRGTGEQWWSIAAVIVVVLMVVLTQLAPVVLLPIFYKYRPLDRPELKERLIALAEKCKTRVVNIFELKLSAKSKAANAALAGWGRTRRILLGDTLLDKYTEEEIEGVLAHELAHHHFAHVWKNMAVQTGVIFLGFFLADQLLRWGVSVFGFEGIADLAAFPLLALAFSGLAIVLLPIINGLSRHFERQSDHFAAEVTGRPEALASALRKLAEQNLADPNPHPLVEFLFHSHPSIGKRIAALEKRD